MYVVNTQHNYGAYRDPLCYKRSTPSVDDGPGTQTPTQFVRAKQRIHQRLRDIIKPTLLQLLSFILTVQVFLMSAT